ncbi:Coenzyme A biosynthesis bifunctional protein CoaBC [Alphaproteobacteria bacterium SO-S41]|nr:Coenzyme A biosynthesis bifunctional protein CoaBC [Alphaproteobacteria bacterium SO-S41]
MSAKRILLIVGGGIAAYKALELVRLLKKRGDSVKAVLTKAGAEFVTPLSLGSLTGEKVFQDLFSLTDEAEMGHIELSRAADLVVVAPATADLMAKAANGLANDLASTLLLATDKKVLMAPAMNVRMWLHAATARNLKTLQDDGVTFVGPNDGSMACGEYGPGRMAEPAEILAAIDTVLGAVAATKPLSGLKAIVTSGPTHEPIDPVRYIANRSSGKQGHAIAAALVEAGAAVTLISGPVDISPPLGVTLVKVETAREMLAAAEAALPADIAVCAAAVADWRVAADAEQKIKKTGDAPAPLALTENPDILATLSRHPFRRPKLVIGFAAETENLIAHARAKLAKKGCDWIVANDVSPATGIMGGDSNQVSLITAGAEDNWPSLSKTEVAARLTQRIAAHFGKP